MKLKENATAIFNNDYNKDKDDNCDDEEEEEDNDDNKRDKETGEANGKKMKPQMSSC